MKNLKCAECGGSGKVPCKSCLGTGKVAVVCHSCNGSRKNYVKCSSCTNGYVIDPDDDRKVKCQKCHGSGKIENGNCPSCDGSGKEMSNCPECNGDGKLTCSLCGGNGVATAQVILNDAAVFNQQTGEFFEAECDSRYPWEDDGVWWFDVLKDAAIAGDSVAAWACLHANGPWDSDAFEDTEENAEITEKMRELALNTEFSKRETFREAKEKVSNGDPGAVALLMKLSSRDFPLAYALLAIITHIGLFGVQRDDEKAIDYCRKCIGAKFPTEIPGLTKGYLRRLESFANSLPVAAQNNVSAMMIVAKTLNTLWWSTGCRDMVASRVCEWCQRIVASSSSSDLEKGGKIRLELEKLAEDSCQESVTQKVTELLQGGETEKNDAANSVADSLPQQSAGAQAKPQAAKENEDDENDDDDNDDESTSIDIDPSNRKKRFVFVFLGLFLGLLGLHFVYAKRWGLLLLHIVFVCATLAFPLCAVLCLSTWLGGTFFVKKDGSGNRMA